MNRTNVQTNTADIAYISPNIVTWAIERSGLSHKEIENSLKTPERQIYYWEQGLAYPSFNKAIKLAEVLRIPFGYLFLAEPPEIEVPLPDLRTFTTSQSHTPSVDFLEVLNTVMVQQDWYREYALQQGAEDLPFVKKFTVSDDIIEVSTDIRRTLGMDSSIPRNSKNWSEYLMHLTRRAEAAGIMVMRNGQVGNSNNRPLQVKEFRGFAINDKIAPLVFINANDFETSKIFTLLHEISHIWLGKSGISNPDEILPDTSLPIVETFCNAVAAETLVPKKEFITLWRDYFGFNEVDRLAAIYRVSTLVILRRAKDLDLISSDQFFDWVKKSKSQITPKKRKESGGGNFFVTAEARVGSKFFEAVLNDVWTGGTMYREGARLLNMLVPTFVGYLEGKKKS